MISELRSDALISDLFLVIKVIIKEKTSLIQHSLSEKLLEQRSKAPCRTNVLSHGSIMDSPLVAI